MYAKYSKWKLGVREIEGEILCVSQFTLLASLKKGNKPDFHQSANGLKAKTLYQAFYKRMGELYAPEKVKDGVFAAMMDVALVNDGPVGVDYSCLDGEVLPHLHISHPPPHPFCPVLLHLHIDFLFLSILPCVRVVGNELTCDIKVTIQIDTDPPKMDDPTSLGTVDAEDLVKKMVNITKEFQLHPELLE